MILKYQLKNVPFLRDADGCIVMIAWCVRRIQQFGPETKFVDIFTCLFNSTTVPLSAGDVGIVINLTLHAKFADLVRLHNSLIKWGQHEKLVKSVCKSIVWKF